MRLRKKQLTLEERVAIVLQYKDGVSTVDLASKYNCSKRHIFNFIRKQKETQSLVDKPKIDRRKIFTDAENRKLKLLVKRNPTISVRNLQKEMSKIVPVSVATIGRKLKNLGMKSYVIRKKPYLTEKNRKLRLEFAQKYRDKPVEFWRNVLWTDETAISLNGTYGKKYFKSEKELRKKREITQPTQHSGGGKIIIWGCVSFNGKGTILKCPKPMAYPFYLCDILNEVALPEGDRLIGTDFVVQQDNAPIHTGIIVKKYLRDLSIPLLKRPPQNPGLNPIENIWHLMKSRVIQRVGKSEDETFEDAERAWNEIPQEAVQNCIDSMPRRLQAVIDANGKSTKY